jgi:hypothetical protein
MKKILYTIISVVFLFVSCKKDNPETKLGKLDITDAYALAMCQNDSVTNNAGDTLKLYKISTDDKLHYVRQYAADGAFLGFLYQPIAMYDLNKKYFVFIATKNGSAKTETYLINKADGTAVEVSNFELPQTNNSGGWKVDQSNRVFLKSNATNYYYIGANGINNFSINEPNNPFALVVSDYTANFDSDTAGNVIAGNDLMYSSGTSTVIAEIEGNTIISRTGGKGFYMIKRQEAAIQISSININDNSYSIEPKGTINESAADWKYLGSASFSGSKSVVLVFNLGLLYIDANIQTLFSFAAFGLSEIESFSQSDTYLVVNGLNTLQNEVMLKINPQNGSPMFSHILVPQRYHFYNYQVDETGNFVFFAKDKVKTTDVIGYLSAAQYVNIIDNVQHLVPRQMLSVK